MAAKKKNKKMTAAKKKYNKELREHLRVKGILPPVKPRLDRKKFANEVIQEFNVSFRIFDDSLYLLQALKWLAPPASVKTKITPETVGILKFLKLAMEIKKFEEEKTKKGETSYTYGEIYENVVAPIKRL